jgi:hypothetical protein
MFCEFEIITAVLLKIRNLTGCDAVSLGELFPMFERMLWHRMYHSNIVCAFRVSH